MITVAEIAVMDNGRRSSQLVIVQLNTHNGKVQNTSRSQLTHVTWDCV